MAKLLETFAKKHNYEYDTAENGLPALQAFQHTQNPYDIVYMGKKFDSKCCHILTKK